MGYAGDERAVLALADHQSGVIVTIFAEVTDEGKELLMPRTEDDASAVSKVITPWLFVYHLQAECP